MIHHTHTHTTRTHADADAERAHLSTTCILILILILDANGDAQARASSPAVVALTAAMGAGGVCGAGLGRKRKREAADIVEVSLESRYLSELGDSRFELVPLLGHGKSHHFSSQVWRGVLCCGVMRLCCTAVNARVWPRRLCGRSGVCVYVSCCVCVLFWRIVPLG